jgi:hypothetical protein
MQKASRRRRRERRPLYARGIRMSYATLPVWSKRLLALLYTFTAVCAWYVTGFLIIQRITNPPREGLTSFLLFAAILFIISLGLTRKAMRVWRKVRVNKTRG